MIVKDFTTTGGHECIVCRRDPLFMAQCLCERWYCEDHLDKHYEKCAVVIERTTPQPLREP